MRKIYDYLIIGAGPAGLQMGLFMEKASQDYLILEAEPDASTFFEKYPRHRTLLSINKVFTGCDDKQLNFRWDWNSLLSNDDQMLFKHYSKKFFPHADDLVRYFRDFADHFELKIRYNTRITRISKERDNFGLLDADGNSHICRNLLVATGMSRAYVPDIPGIEFAEKYAEVTMDPRDFENQRVLIIGKGNSAFETAEHIADTTASIHLTSPNPLKLAWKSHHVGHLRAINNNFLDTYLLKMKNGMIEAYIKKIARKETGAFSVSFDLTRAHDDTCTIEYDRIILCAGFCFDDSCFHDSCKPELAYDERLPKQTSQWESTNIENLYFIGTLMQMRDYKKTQSSFIHGFRYNIRALHRMLETKNHGKEWPHDMLPKNPETIGDTILDHINRCAALWHQPGFLCDVAVIREDRVFYYPELPMDYVAESEFGKENHYYVISLEYGPDHQAFPFEFDRFTDASNAHLNPQLHPIIRRFNGSRLVAEHHILEEIEGRWVEPVFVDPLISFLSEQVVGLNPRSQV